jgi:predicted RNA-binding protein
MCQSNVYVVENGSEKLLMKDVSWIETEGALVRLKDLDGAEKSLAARLSYADLVGHKIVLEPTARQAVQKKR